MPFPVLLLCVARTHSFLEVLKFGILKPTNSKAPGLFVLKIIQVFKTFVGLMFRDKPLITLMKRLLIWVSEVSGRKKTDGFALE